MVTKSDIKEFWEQYPLMFDEITAELGSQTFFSEQEKIYEEEVFAGQGFPEDFFPFPPKARILDVGCGPGIWTRQLAKRDYIVTAIDLTTKAIEQTRRSLVFAGLKAELRQADAEQLPFADNSFEGVVSHGVIHHTPDTQKCIEEVGRVLTKNGVAVVSVYYRNFILRSKFLTKIISRLFRKKINLPGRGRNNLLFSGDPDEIVRMYDGEKNPLGKSYTKNEFISMFEQAGFLIIGTKRFYFPKRAFGIFRNIIVGQHKYLSKYFGLMIAIVVRKV